MNIYFMALMLTAYAAAIANLVNGSGGIAQLGLLFLISIGIATQLDSANNERRTL